MPTISVIVPVYKVEKYLAKCIESILNQTYKDFELILVDDGSPDNCGAICDEYAKNYSCIKVIHKPNGGLSDARNTGIDYVMKNSQSSWIAFIDSDDYITDVYLEKLYNEAIRTQAEIVMCDFKRVDEEGNSVEKKHTFPCGVFSNIEACEIFYSNWRTVVAWNKLYKREIFTELRYDVGKLHEDDFIIHKLFSVVKKVAYITDVLHYYVIRGNSIMTSEKKIDADLLFLEINVRRYWYCKQHGLPIDKKIPDVSCLMDVIQLESKVDSTKINRYRLLKKEYKKLFLDYRGNAFKYRVLYFIKNITKK